MFYETILGIIRTKRIVPSTCLSRFISCSSSASRVRVWYSCRPAPGVRPLFASASSLYNCRCSSCFRRSSISWGRKDTSHWSVKIVLSTPPDYDTKCPYGCMCSSTSQRLAASPLEWPPSPSGSGGVHGSACQPSSYVTRSRRSAGLTWTLLRLAVSSSPRE